MTDTKKTDSKKKELTDMAEKMPGYATEMAKEAAAANRKDTNVELDKERQAAGDDVLKNRTVDVKEAVVNSHPGKCGFPTRERIERIKDYLRLTGKKSQVLPGFGYVTLNTEVK